MGKFLILNKKIVRGIGFTLKSYELNNKLTNLLQHIKGDRNIDITWQKVAKRSKYSFYIEGCANAFFHHEGIEYFAVVETTKIENQLSTYKVDFVCKLDPTFIDQLQAINIEAGVDVTFQKDHYLTLDKITFTGILTRTGYEMDMNIAPYQPIINRHHYPTNKCYLLGHLFTHKTRQKFVAEHRVNNKDAKMECERCKEKYSMYEIQNMSSPLHELVFTYPSFFIHRLVKMDFIITQKQFIESANGWNLNVGYFGIGLAIGTMIGASTIGFLFAGIFCGILGNCVFEYFQKSSSKK